MPELPEVETVRRGLAEHVCGRAMIEVIVHHPRAVRHILGGAGELQSELRNRTITGLGRRGKFLWLHLHDHSADDHGVDLVGTAPHQPAQPVQPHRPTQAGDPVLVVHLGMSGQLLIKDPNADSKDPRFPHCRIQVRFDDDTQLWFVDQRTFGYWLPAHLTDAGQGLVPDTATHIARDLLDSDLDVPAVAATMHSKTLAVKKLLLNQEIIAGIGNIYADEMLWAAQINPNQPANTIDPADLAALLQAGQDIMRAAITRGGTSFDDLYVNVNGESGYFDVELHAYGQDGQPCDRCGTILVKEKFTNRSSHYCPQCQPLRPIPPTPAGSPTNNHQ